MNASGTSLAPMSVIDASTTNWSTQQLVEFLDVAASAENASQAADRAVERAAEALDAEIAAIVRGSALVTSVGFPRGQVPERALVFAAHNGSDLELEGLGRCAILSVPVGNDMQGRLLVARLGDVHFDKADANLLHGFGGALGLAFRILESQRMKDEFFALVSHELRTPLTSIIGYLDVIADDTEALSEKRQRWLDVVNRNAKRLQRLVGDLLFSAQVNANKFEIELGPMQLDSLASESVEAALPNAQSRGIELSAAIDPLPRVVGDANRMSQALDNLLSNAMKFTPAGGRVRVSVRRDGNSILITVEDSGVGIPKAEQPRLFERFYRSSNTVNGAAEGAGLGLAIVKAIVEGHEGRIGIESEEGVGTAIRIELPLHPYLADIVNGNGSLKAPERQPQVAQTAGA
jgi:signal transduction histidine kinase